MADILNEITDGLNELIKETDDKYDKFLFEGSNDDLLKTFFSLIKYNGGEFKSDKQKNYLRRNGDYFYLTKTSYFGDNQGAKAETAYEVFLDDIGVVKIIKWSKNKTQQQLFWERTADSMRKSQETRINSDFGKALSDDMRARELEHEKVLDSIVEKVREAQGGSGTLVRFDKEKLESQIRQFTTHDSSGMENGVDMAKFNDHYNQIKDYVKNNPIIGYMLVLFDELNEYFKLYPQGFQRWNPKFYDMVKFDNYRPEFQSIEAKKAYLDSLQSQQPIQEEGNQPRILQVISAYEKAAQEADDVAFNGEQNDDNSGWNGTFANAMSPRAGVQYQEYMKKQLQTNDSNTNASELQDKAQVLADEIKKEYQWIVKATRGKGMKQYAGLSDMIKYFKQKYSQQPLNEESEPTEKSQWKKLYGKKYYATSGSGMGRSANIPNIPAIYRIYEYNGYTIHVHLRQIGKGWEKQYDVCGFKNPLEYTGNSDIDDQKGYCHRFSNQEIDWNVVADLEKKAEEEAIKRGDPESKPTFYDLLQRHRLHHIYGKQNIKFLAKPSFMNEVGEASAEAYPFTRDDYNKEYIYKFTTEDGDNYIVNVMGMKNSWIIDYRLATIDSSFLDVVNKGRVYKVMATLYKIMQDFVKTVDPDVIRFEPTKNNTGDDRRYKLYNAFIKKNIPFNYSMKYKEPYGFTLTKKQSLSRD